MHGAVLQLHHDLEEAAQVGGVSWANAMRYIVLPLLFPSIVSGWVFVALHAVRETTMALMLYSPSSRVISLLMWDTWQSGDVNKAAATGVVVNLNDESIEIWAVPEPDELLLLLPQAPANMPNAASAETVATPILERCILVLPVSDSVAFDPAGSRAGRQG